MSPMTLRSLERGGAGVTMGAYLAVLQVLGMDEDLDLVARDDTLGRALQDARLSSRTRPREESGDESTPDAGRGRSRGLRDADTARPSMRPSDVQESSERGGFVDSDDLANLIRPAATASKRKR